MSKNRFCECGCGERVRLPQNRYIAGHHIRARKKIYDEKVKNAADIAEQKIFEEQRKNAEETDENQDYDIQEREYYTPPPAGVEPYYLYIAFLLGIIFVRSCA